MDKKKYVVVFAYDKKYPERVLLVLKDRPTWMVGCLNLLGGKVEKDEHELDAALRELKEESGLELKSSKKQQIKLMGAIITDASIIYCISIPVDSKFPIVPRSGETEKSAWYDWSEIKIDKRLMPNLRCLIPLMRCGVSGWFANGDPLSDDVYDMRLRFLLDHPVPHHPENQNV